MLHELMQVQQKVPTQCAGPQDDFRFLPKTTWSNLYLRFSPLPGAPIMGTDPSRAKATSMQEADFRQLPAAHMALLHGGIAPLPGAPPVSVVEAESAEPCEPACDPLAALQAIQAQCQRVLSLVKETSKLTKPDHEGMTLDAVANGTVGHAMDRYIAKLRVHFSFRYLDYDKVASNPRAWIGVIQQIQKTLNAHLGVPEDSVDVELHKGLLVVASLRSLRPDANSKFEAVVQNCVQNL
jgi:hypothetical protein